MSKIDRPVRLPLTDARQTLEAEALRVDAIKGQAAPPPQCGPDMPVAPARGAFRLWQDWENVPGSTVRRRATGYRAHGEGAPRVAIRTLTALDRMEAEALRRHPKGEGAEPYVRMFLQSQLDIASTYRTLADFCEAGGVRCQSLEARAMPQGGGSGRGFIDSYIAARDELARLRARIGNGVAMEVRRVRPSARGVATAGLIKTRALVDAVVLQDMTLSEVLRSCGWSQTGDHRARLRAALCAALDRMQGVGLHGGGLARQKGA